MKRTPRGGKFWPISRLATVMEVSQASVVAAARLTGKAILPGGVVWFAAKDGKRGRPDRGFIEESHRANLAESRQQARQQAEDKSVVC